MSPERKKTKISDLFVKKNRGEAITMVTAYDYPTALLADRAGLDAILVGDSLSVAALGNESKHSVTMDAMIYHAQAVRRGTKYAFLIGDMPFMSYEADVRDAVRNAGRFLKEAGMDAVKLEGGRDLVDAIRAIVSAGIPVQGHIGLTPESISKYSGFGAQGNDAISARGLLEDALALQDAGCFSILLEAVPDRVAGLVTGRLHIPTIGIGSGSKCDGQIILFGDLAGMPAPIVPKFSKKYVDLAVIITTALEQYCTEVKSRSFPSSEHCDQISDEEFEKLVSGLT